ncbi:MAG: histidine phosphatase family protein [Chloracidobacterium sp.]|nr:histidine phosphatase family protein [Chloracidobacterium sp.]
MPPPTRLYLIRHGQSAGNAEGRFGGQGPTPLSELGQRQADLTAKLLAKEGVRDLFERSRPCSTDRRTARKTTRIRDKYVRRISRTPRRRTRRADL